MKKTPGKSETLWVRTASRRYPVWLSPGLLGRSGPALRHLRPGLRQLTIVSSPRVWRLWGPTLTGGLRAGGLRTCVLLMNDREEDKRLATVEKLAGKLLESGADRDALLLALGGGVVGDVAGFLAATYMRGVDCVQVPTTLVAMVDSALGGKTGVNLRDGKNLLGSFHQPLAVLVDTQTLSTLPAREFRSGLYEVVKTAILGDASLFRYLEANLAKVRQRDASALRKVVTGCARVKARVVSRDEHEQGLRQVLNLGHTIGHALETLASYRGIKHGEAVGWGLLGATRLAVRLGRLSPGAARRISALVRAVGPLPALPRASAKRILAQMQADKKRRGGRLRFVLPVAVGRVQVSGDVPRGQILATLCELPLLAEAR